MTRSIRSYWTEPVLCWSIFSRHIPASLAFAIRALTAAAEPPFSDIAFVQAASASAIKLSIVTFALAAASAVAC